jgi:5-hydroxyisourate hydrolase-like protein (transthyretin family)
MSLKYSTSIVSMEDLGLGINANYLIFIENIGIFFQIANNSLSYHILVLISKSTSLVS